MSEKIKPVVVGFIVIFLLAIFFLNWQERLKAQEELKQTRTEAESRIKELQASLNDANTVITGLEKRTDKVKRVIVNVPAECKDCIGKFRLPYEVKDQKGLVSYKTNDVFTEIGKFDLDFEKICNPYIDALDKCEKVATRSEKKVQFVNEVTARAGLIIPEGYRGELSYKPVRVGVKKLDLKPAVWAGSDFGPVSQRFYAGVGLEVSYRR